MSASTIAILLILAGITVVVLLWPLSRKPRVHMIDAIDLMRLQDAKRARTMGRPRWTPWVISAIIPIIAIAFVSLLSGAFRGSYSIAEKADPRQTVTVEELLWSIMYD